MNTSSSQRALTSDIQTTQPPSSESIQTDTDSPSMNFATRRDSLIQILQKSSEITKSIDRMLLSVIPQNPRASTRYTRTDSILTEQERDAIRLEAESNSSTLARFRLLVEALTSSESYEITNGKKTRTGSN